MNIARFELENKMYFINITKNNKLEFIKKDKSKITIDELIIYKKVLKELIVDKRNSIFETNIIIQNRKYKLFYDNNSNNYFWESINQKEDKKINELLNFKYNQEIDFVFLNTNSKKENNETQKNKKEFQKNIKIGKKIVKIFIRASISLLAISSICNIYYQTINSYENNIISGTFIANHSQEYYDWNKLEKNIDTNSNIGKEEKAFIKKLKFVFDENNKYMNLELIYDRLKTLKIEYVEEDNELKKCHAYYNQITNTIVYQGKNFKSVEKWIFLHEFLHVLQDGGSKLFTNELSNEFFTREIIIRMYNENMFDKKEGLLNQKICKIYKDGLINLKTEADWLYFISISNGFGNGYGYYMPIYYILAELLPKEALKMYQFAPNRLDYLSNPLKLDDNNIISSEELINIINELRIYDPEHEDYIYNMDNNNLLEFLSYLDDYYKIFKGIHIEEDISLFPIVWKNNGIILKNSAEYINYFQNNYNIYFDERIGIIKKTYLSNSQEDDLIIYSNDFGVNCSILKIDEKLKKEIKYNIETPKRKIIAKKNKICNNNNR